MTAVDARAPGPPGRSTGRRRLRWGAVGGVAAVTYVVALTADAVLLTADGSTYTDVHARLDGTIPRAVVALVLIGVLGHALDGLRRLAVAAGVRAVTEARLRVAVAFLLPALGIPLVAAVLWPALEGTVG